MLLSKKQFDLKHDHAQMKSLNSEDKSITKKMTTVKLPANNMESESTVTLQEGRVISFISSALLKLAPTVSGDRGFSVTKMTFKYTVKFLQTY